MPNFERPQKGFTPEEADDINRVLPAEEKRGELERGLRNAQLEYIKERGAVGDLLAFKINEGLERLSGIDPEAPGRRLEKLRKRNPEAFEKSRSTGAN